MKTTDIAAQLDQILDTGLEDAAWRVHMAAQIQGYGPRATDVDDLDAHEIYERAATQAAVETALIRHGEYEDASGHVVIREINGLDLNF
ncbi:hypothetical protein [Corynebacterium suicordis]|uniref:Uncharacterized protein n=1 Tax=Corynebacterium suicordis DSM 45110 TaxID=1121369 RepID=A0ABR9ZLU5_9CORY|nr:hypothetical protein [Corynebacterium suicordis]MBF4554359.1 hypothetical protein [Corynebacterium suicordis DSM 45110]MDR6278618.1 hypothetical protein [Corynebacterium suicordis]